MNPANLKISFLLPNGGIGGGVRAIVRFANELLARGHSVRIFYRKDIDTIADRFRCVYQSLRYPDSHDWLLDFKGESIKYDKLKAELFSAGEMLLSMCARTTLDAWELPRKDVMKVLHCHGAEIENWEAMLKAWKLPMPKIVVSSSLIDMIKKETGQDALGVAEDGVDTSEYYPSLPESMRTCIGGTFRWRQSKDPAATIRIMQMLKGRLPEVPLYSYGTGRKPNALKNVRYIRQPSITQARDMYSRCKVWFLASIDEGFGLPILEAMACGCAVVSTDCGGPRDIIEDGVNGFLVNVGNTGDMVHKIVMLYEDEELRRKICANAMKTAHQFTWGAGAAKLEQFLLSIHEEKSGISRRDAVLEGMDES